MVLATRGKADDATVNRDNPALYRNCNVGGEKCFCFYSYKMLLR